MAVVIVVVLGAATAAVVVRRDDGPSHPDGWDPRVADIAAFVERTRGLRFEHPVAIDFLAEDDFRAELTATDRDLSDEDRVRLDQQVAEFRALGLISGDLDLLAEIDKLTGESTAAFYDPVTERIVVRGTDLDPAVRATVAHEVTHALQDQHFDLEALEDEAGDDGTVRIRSVVEGDSQVVERAYIDQELSGAEQGEVQDRSAAAVEGADVGDVPEVLQAVFGAPYAFGDPFVTYFHAQGGTSRVDDLFEAPPASEAPLLDPRRYGELPEPVDTPAIPDGASTIDEGELGSLSWFLVLASRIDGRQALRAVDGWAGDRYVTYDQDGRVCVQARFLGRDQAATDRVLAALDGWSATLPPGMATITRPGDRAVEVRSCDPGPATDLTVPRGLAEEVVWPVSRLGVMAGLAEAMPGIPADRAWCVGEGVVDQLRADQLLADETPPEVRAIATTVAQGCGVGP